MDSVQQGGTALACDIGRKRRTNEDYALACEPSDSTLRRDKGRLYIVADGIGGGAAGEVASEFAAHSIAHYYYAHKGTPAQRLFRSLSNANADIYRVGQSHPRLRTMGTTVVAVAVLGDTLCVAHVGDSRAYLIRAGKPQPLTEDHNLAAQLAREGMIARIRVAHHPYRNLLLRSLGAERTALPDFRELALEPGDVLLLCSDGLTRHVPDDEIARIASGNTPTEAVSSLVDLANHRGGEDNIAVLITRWGSESHTELAQGVLAAPPPPPDISAILRSAHTRHPNR